MTVYLIRPSSQNMHIILKLLLKKRPQAFCEGSWKTVALTREILRSLFSTRPGESTKHGGFRVTWYRKGLTWLPPKSQTFHRGLMSALWSGENHPDVSQPWTSVLGFLKSRAWSRCPPHLDIWAPKDGKDEDGDNTGLSFLSSLSC